MTFKDQVTADVPTFLNVGEFADTVEVNGEAVACILDEADSERQEEGVSKIDVTLYVATGGIPTPAVGQRMQLGERKANVVKVEENQGILAVGLVWWNS